MSTKKEGKVWILFLLAAVFASLWLFSWFETEPPTTTQSVSAIPTRSKNGFILIGGKGRGDQTSIEFPVMAGCPRQEIQYGGNRLDKDLDVAFVHFRVIDKNGRGVEHQGPADLLDSPQGSGIWTLDPGIYVVEISSGNASWEYEVRCR